MQLLFFFKFDESKPKRSIVLVLYLILKYAFVQYFLEPRTVHILNLCQYLGENALVADE